MHSNVRKRFEGLHEKLLWHQTFCRNDELFILLENRNWPLVHSETIRLLSVFDSLLANATILKNAKPKKTMALNKQLVNAKCFCFQIFFSFQHYPEISMVKNNCDLTTCVYRCIMAWKKFCKELPLLLIKTVFLWKGSVTKSSCAAKGLLWALEKMKD